MSIISMNKRTTVPEEIRDLEAAPVGCLASVPGRPDMGFAQKARDSGRSWTLGATGQRVTVYMIHNMGFRAPEREVVEDLREVGVFDPPSAEIARDHLRRLMNSGMTLREVAERADVPLESVKGFSKGKYSWAQTPERLTALMRVPPSGKLAFRSRRLTMPERLEDLEWLLVCRVPWRDAAVRAGWSPSVPFNHVYKAARDHGFGTVTTLLEQTDAYLTYEANANTKENAA